MPKGVRGSGATRERILPPDKAREMREKLQAQLRQIEEQDTLRYAAIGRAVEKEAESDLKLAAQLQGILARNVTDRGERMCLGLSTRGRGRPRRAAGSQAGMQGPFTASTDDVGPTGPAER